MGSQVSWPNKRLTQSGIGNPLFITDIENANEDLLEALAVLYGFASNGFAIVSGFVFDPSGSGIGTYSSGIVYMNGVFYKSPVQIVQGSYLSPNIQDVQNKIFGDANTYSTYRVYEAQTSVSQWGGMPRFLGDMNQYRISIKKLWDTINSYGNIVTHNTSEFDAAGAAAAAQAAAASDATTKANTAQSNAIAAAAADATSKMNSAVALADSNAQSDDIAYFTSKFDNWQNTTIGGETSIVSNFSKHLKLPRTLIINLYLEITKGALLGYISLITSDYVVSISQSGANDLGTSGFCLCYDSTSAIYIPCYIALAGITTHTQTLMQIKRIDGLDFVSGHVYLITGSITAKSFIA